MIKERPILFSGSMVRALLEGRKTQTRRIIKPQPQVTEQRLRETGGWVQGMTLSEQVNAAWQAGFVDVKSPHGKPGERLWVREAWHTDTLDLAEARAQHEDAMSISPVFYKADPVNDNAGCIWRPSIFMPRWASRILLEITDVRVERLQDITPRDAMAEGVEGKGSMKDAVPDNGWRMGYRDLWESINGDGSWDKNPWVWCISFKVIAN